MYSLIRARESEGLLAFLCLPTYAEDGAGCLPSSCLLLRGSLRCINFLPSHHCTQRQVILHCSITRHSEGVSENFLPPITSRYFWQRHLWVDRRKWKPPSTVSWTVILILLPCKGFMRGSSFPLLSQHSSDRLKVGLRCWILFWEEFIGRIRCSVLFSHNRSGDFFSGEASVVLSAGAKRELLWLLKVGSSLLAPLPLFFRIPFGFHKAVHVALDLRCHIQPLPHFPHAHCLHHIEKTQA